MDQPDRPEAGPADPVSPLSPGHSINSSDDLKKNRPAMPADMAI
jgi:hypothetical protein